MSKARPLIFGAALGASAMFFAQQYHVVHSHDGLRVIPRTPQQSLGLAYTDIRNWGPSQWTDRPELARALMASGATSLISESVAATLADRVSEDTSTLDELRSFLNTSKRRTTDDFDMDLLTPLPSETSGSASSAGTERSKGAESKGAESSDADLFRIPFPRDARTRIPADPFREARSADLQPGVVPDTRSRFTAEDLTGPDQAAAFEEVTQRPAVATPRSDSTRRYDSVAAQADEMVNRLFGGLDDVSRPTSPAENGTRTGTVNSAVSETAQPRAVGLPPAGSASSGSVSSGSSAASPFEEVTTQLQNRAQEALNRAQEAAKDKAGSAGEATLRDVSGFLRSRAGELAGESTRSLIGTDAGSGVAPSNPLKLDFDPFLE